MRKEIDCEIRRPIGPELPVAFQTELEAAHGEGFLVSVVEAFDRALAPVHLVLDELGAYLDPFLAPDDVLVWLLGWLGVPDDRNRAVQDQRRLLADAAELYRDTGTAAGLRAQLAEVLGWEVEIVENGAAVASSDPEVALPGEPALALHISVGTPAGVDPSDPGVVRRVNSLVRALKPVHVPHTVEVVSSSGAGGTDTPSSASTAS